ncbi:hypothetical protein DUI87_23056 [Hirundo rustica rustica]|uniref:Uncharacterized protein n=1 Tax=Hirundo rustica rustica TaxID=333673 RepID=A0A3M0JHG0_HIRRU|nr:hypothetical protein DUI87_23056 [Hirundo rustica rustica]
MDRPSYLEEDYSSLDGLDDDVFHSDDFGLAGSAGYRLHLPPAGFVLDPHLQEEPQEGQREARAEVQIARKLQCIADQFHRLHIQRDSNLQLRMHKHVAASPIEKESFRGPDRSDPKTSSEATPVNAS